MLGLQALGLRIFGLELISAVAAFQKNAVAAVVGFEKSDERPENGANNDLDVMFSGTKKHMQTERERGNTRPWAGGG